MVVGEPGTETETEAEETETAAGCEVTDVVAGGATACDSLVRARFCRATPCCRGKESLAGELVEVLDLNSGSLDSLARPMAGRLCEKGRIESMVMVGERGPKIQRGLGRVIAGECTNAGAVIGAQRA